MLQNYEKKIKGVLHWVAAEEAVDVEARIYDHLFLEENVMALGDNWIDHVNPNSLVVRAHAKIDKRLAGAKELDKFQFERLGFFVVDKDSTADKLVFNRVISLVESKTKKTSDAL